MYSWGSYFVPVPNVFFIPIFGLFFRRSSIIDKPGACNYKVDFVSDNDRSRRNNLKPNCQTHWIDWVVGITGICLPVLVFDGYMQPSIGNGAQSLIFRVLHVSHQGQRTVIRNRGVVTDDTMIRGYLLTLGSFSRSQKLREQKNQTCRLPRAVYSAPTPLPVQI